MGEISGVFQTPRPDGDLASVISLVEKAPSGLFPENTSLRKNLGIYSPLMDLARGRGIGREYSTLPIARQGVAYVGRFRPTPADGGQYRPGPAITRRGTDPAEGASKATGRL